MIRILFVRDVKVNVNSSYTGIPIRSIFFLKNGCGKNANIFLTNDSPSEEFIPWFALFLQIYNLICSLNRVDVVNIFVKSHAQRHPD